MNIKIIMTLCLVACFLIAANMEEPITQLLSSDDWRDRDNAISLINKNFEQYKDNDAVKKAVLSALIEENNAIKYLRANKSVRPTEMGRGEGRGEYYLSTLKLVIKLDIPNSTEALLDSVNLGNGVQEALAKKLSDGEQNDMETLLSLKQKLESSDIFYKGNRSAYLRVINKYLLKERPKGIPKQEIIRNIVFDGLIGQDFFAKKYAIRCSIYFPEDQQIIEKLQDISKTDNYMENRDGEETSPLKEEALNALKTIQKQK